MLPDSLPRSFRRVLSRCLRKDPRRRLRDIGDARLELEEAMDPSGTPAGPEISSTADFRAILVGRILNLAVVTQRIGIAATSRLLARSDANAREMVNRYQGREGDRTPEGFSATFDLPSDALRCALVCQTEWGKLESEDSLELAIGIHAAEDEPRERRVWCAGATIRERRPRHRGPRGRPGAARASAPFRGRGGNRETASNHRAGRLAGSVDRPRTVHLQRSRKPPDLRSWRGWRLDAATSRRHGNRAPRAQAASGAASDLASIETLKPPPAAVERAGLLGVSLVVVPDPIITVYS